MEVFALNKRTVLLAIGAIAASIALAYSLGQRSASVPATGTVKESDEAATIVRASASRPVGQPKPAESHATESKPHRSSTPVSERPALPPPGTPIAKSYDTLAARARAGDPHASCRLAYELERCGMMRTLRWHVAGDVERAELQAWKNAPPDKLDRLVDVRARQREAIAKLEVDCAGLAPSRPDEWFDWVLLSANQGSVAAASRFATRGPFVDPRMLERLDRYASYRDRAPELALRALEGGDLEIVGALADAYATPADMPYRGPLAQLIKPDLGEAYALSRLEAMLSAEPDPPLDIRIEKLAKQLTPAQREAGEARAASLRNGPYAGRVKPKARYDEVLERDYCTDGT